MPHPVINTKLFAPALRPESILRPRMSEIFKDGLHRRMTLVCAPAGFGKSSLISECIAEVERDVAWLSLDAMDSDPDRFLSYLIASLQTISANIGDAILVSLDAEQKPPCTTLLTMLVNELTSWRQNLVLVLDDYHLVDSNEVDETLAFLLEHAPPNLHLVIATREDPQLPLARLRARGQLTELRAADLRFTLTEASDFLTKTMRLKLSAENIAALEVRTEGWIAGLQMAALSLRDRPDQNEFIDAFSGSHRFVLDYLAEEVLQGKDDSTREFFLKTAILERLSGSLCDAVTEQGNGELRLQLLERDNQFIVPLDEERNWYRYHHLFADVLLARLKQEPTDLVSTLHLRASKWFEKNNYPNDAIEHAIAAEDFERTAEIIENTWPELRKSEPESTFLTWMDKIQDEQILSRPVLSTYFGLALLDRDLERSLRFFDTAERLLAQEKTKHNIEPFIVSNQTAFEDIPGLLAVGRAYQAGTEGNLQGIVENAERALTLLDNKAAIWRGLAAILLGVVHWNLGHLDLAYNVLADGRRSLKQGREFSGAISTTYLMANLRIGLGNFCEATRLCEQSRKFSQEIGGPALQGTSDIYVTLAAIKSEQNELDMAECLLNDALDLGAQSELLESRHLWFVVKARIESCRGNYENALQLLNEAEEQRIPSPSPSTTPIDALQAQIHILEGQLSLAQDWADSKQLTHNDELSYTCEFEHLIIVRLLIAQYRQSGANSRLEEATSLISRLLVAATSGKRMKRIAECHMLLALVLDASKEKKECLAALESALHLAKPQGYIRTFLDEGQPMQALLKKVPKHSNEASFAATILSSHSGVNHRNATPQSLILAEPLSDRELEVLRLLSSDLSGPEIANQLYISLNTMRTHTKNIYSKLEVNSRRAAVKRSEQLELFAAK